MDKSLGPIDLYVLLDSMAISPIQTVVVPKLFDGGLSESMPKKGLFSRELLNSMSYCNLRLC